MSELRNTLESLREGLLTSLSAKHERTTIGNFEAFINLVDAYPWSNYAVPVEETNSEDLPRLAAHFRGRQRTPRLEYFHDLNPELEGKLLMAGFTCDLRAPVMSILPDQFAPRPRNLARMVEEHECIPCTEAANEAFEAEMGVDADDKEEYATAIREGWYRMAAVYDSDLVVASGILVGKGPIVELAGVGTRPAYRRRGFASMVSSYLCDRHFSNGGEAVWLSAGDSVAEAVYAKLGFAKLGEQLNYSLRD